MRRRLAVVALAVTSLVAVAFAVPLALLVREVARDRALGAAERDAAAIAPLLAATRDEEELEAAIGLTQTGAAGRLTVLLPSGEVVGDQRPLDDRAFDLAQDRSFSTEVEGGVDLYVPVATGPGRPSVVRAHVPDELLTDGVVPAWGALAAVALVLVAAAVLVADGLGRSVTRPAADLAQTARQLAAGDLDARATQAGPPELEAVSLAFNTLAGRVRELLQAERERVADLSHRLRTPLTALRLDAEARGDTALVADVDRLSEAVDRAIVEARRQLDDEAPVDLVAVVRDRTAFWGALADDQGRSWRLDVADDSPLLVRVSGPELEAALDAILGNVFAHTDEGVGYTVAVQRTDGAASVAVEDAGPGIADPSVLARGVSGTGSTGLGLDIARRAAESTGGSLSVGRAAAGGARIELQLRLAVPAHD